jgi:hypothetical protein
MFICIYAKYDTINNIVRIYRYSTCVNLTELHLILISSILLSRPSHSQFNPLRYKQIQLFISLFQHLFISYSTMGEHMGRHTLLHDKQNRPIKKKCYMSRGIFPGGEKHVWDRQIITRYLCAPG